MINYILCINDHHQIYDINMYMYTYKTYNSALLCDSPIFQKPQITFLPISEGDLGPYLLINLRHVSI